jgi:two-component system, NarL family, sensor kinase
MSNQQQLLAELSKLTQQQKDLDQKLTQGSDQVLQLVQRVWQLQEKEQKTLAIELHDGVGQILTALVNQLELLNAEQPAIDKQVAKNNNIETSSVSPEQLLSLARSALEDVRYISRLMRPQILDDLGLEAAVQWLVRQMATDKRLDINVIYADNFLPKDELNIVFFRICQEALSNIIKHASASAVALEFINDCENWRLIVSDNGVGFSQKAVEKSAFGLKNIEDRVTSFGGKLDVTTQCSAGCKLDIQIPKNEL